MQKGSGCEVGCGTVGDKLLPTLLSALPETPGPAIDNLDKAEKLGWIESTEGGMALRRIRNQMVHEHFEHLIVLCSALRSGHAFVPSLVAAARRCVTEAKRIGAVPGAGKYRSSFGNYPAHHENRGQVTL